MFKGAQITFNKKDRKISNKKYLTMNWGGKINLPLVNLDPSTNLASLRCASCEQGSEMCTSVPADTCKVNQP